MARKVLGETRISRSTSPIERIELRPRRPKPLAETLEAIAEADLITLGPGSLFTSVIPNLLVDGIPQAIAALARAQSVFRESDVAARRDHAISRLRSRGRASCATAGRARSRRLIDVCVVNTRPLPARLWIRYRARPRGPWKMTSRTSKRWDFDVVEADLLRMSGQRLRRKDPPRSGRHRRRGHGTGAAGHAAAKLKTLNL